MTPPQWTTGDSVERSFRDDDGPVDDFICRGCATREECQELIRQYEAGLLRRSSLVRLLVRLGDRARLFMRCLMIRGSLHEGMEDESKAINRLGRDDI